MRTLVVGVSASVCTSPSPSPLVSVSTVTSALDAPLEGTTPPVVVVMSGVGVGVGVALSMSGMVARRGPAAFETHGSFCCFDSSIPKDVASRKRFLLSRFLLRFNASICRLRSAGSVEKTTTTPSCVSFFSFEDVTRDGEGEGLELVVRG